MISITVKPSLSLFCRVYFRKISLVHHGHGAECITLPSAHSTQGRLHCTQHIKNAPQCRFNPVSYTGRKIPPREYAHAQEQVSTPTGSGFPCHWGSPYLVQARECFPPASTPNWAFKANTRGFTDMPFKGFLGPSWETATLTRILRRRIHRTLF